MTIIMNQIAGKKKENYSIYGKKQRLQSSRKETTIIFLLKETTTIF
jgi:hypothetical protein